MRVSLADAVRRVVFQRSFSDRSCTHAADVADVGDVSPQSASCPSCDAHGIKPVRLRMCLTCGNVGCCDSSAEHHARDHYEATGHSVMRSTEPGEAWAWCYPDRAYLGSPGTPA